MFRWFGNVEENCALNMTDPEETKSARQAAFDRQSKIVNLKSKIAIEKKAIKTCVVI